MRVLVIAPFLFYFHATFAQDSTSWIKVIEPQSKNELWINPGMYSYHLQKDQNLNSNNWGVGLEYRFNTVASITIGIRLFTAHIGGNFS